MSSSGAATRILSRKSSRWGEVKSPVRMPAEARAEASMLATEPLPLVPATWMLLNRRSGYPRAALKAFILSSPGL